MLSFSFQYQFCPLQLILSERQYIYISIFNHMYNQSVIYTHTAVIYLSTYGTVFKDYYYVQNIDNWHLFQLLTFNGIPGHVQLYGTPYYIGL